MSDRITIKSIFREYHADFIDDFTSPLKIELEKNGVFIIDSNVFNIFKSRLGPLLPDGRFILVEPTEYNKTIDKCKEIIEMLVEKKVRRNEKLIAIGGGVIQDITAFTSSVTYRGLEWVFFPTTLLAQADSCIGSKTSINLGDKKNLIGNFYPPSCIYIDTAFLESLSIEEIKSGIGEMLHFYLYAGSPFFEKIIDNHQNVIDNRRSLLEYMKESLKIKKAVIEIDEFDRNERNKFNYGHTFGHALESLSGYEIKHGQAVTIGMDIANYISVELGLMKRDIFNKLHSMLSVNLPVVDIDIIKYDLESYFALLSKDKKNLGSNLVCILAECPGALIKKQLPFDDNLKGSIRTYFTEEFYRR